MTQTLARKFRCNTGSGRTPLGLLPDGTPIYALMGAAPKDGEDTDGDQGDGDGDDDGDDDGAGDGDDDGDGDGKGKGEKTQAEKDAERVEQARKESQKHRRALAPWKAIARDYGLTPEQVRERLDATKPGKKSGDDGEQVDAEKVRRDADRAATEKANRRIVRAEVKALAADTFTDPADAAAFLDLDDIEVDEDGEVDADEIREQLATLLARKPHLAKTDGTKRKQPKPDASQGSSSKAKAPKSVGGGKRGSLEDGAALYHQLTGKGKKTTP